MHMHKTAQHDTTTPPGQIVNREPQIRTLADYIAATHPGDLPERREEIEPTDALRTLYTAVDNLRRAQRRFALEPSTRGGVTGAEVRLDHAMAAAKVSLGFR